MRSASGHQGEIERQWKKKNVRHSFIKRVTWKFLEVSRRSRAKKTEKTEMYKKSVLHVQSCFFGRSRTVLVALQDFILFLFDQTINIIESFAFRAKSVSVMFRKYDVAGGQAIFEWKLMFFNFFQQ